MRTITLIEAIREAYQEEMRRDDVVFLVGQERRNFMYWYQLEFAVCMGADVLALYIEVCFGGGFAQ